MGDRKLIQLLEILTPRELKKYVSYFESISDNNTAIAVLKYVTMCVKKKKEPAEAGFKKIFGNKAKNIGGEIKKYFRLLTESLENFLAARQLQLKENNAIRNILLLKRLRSVSDNDLFEKTTKKARRGLEKTASGDIFQYYLKAWLEHEVYFSPHAENQEEKIKHIAQIQEAVDASYCLTKLRYTCESLFFDRLIYQDIQTPFMTEILLKSKKYYKNSPLFEIYSTSIELFKEFRPEYFQKLKELIFRDLLKTSVIEQFSIFNMLINHTAHAMRSDHSYQKDALEIYRYGMTNGLLEEDGHIVMEHFINYVNMLCSVERTKSAQIFVNEYAKKLDESIRDQVVQISESRILNTEKKFKDAFVLLYQKTFKHLKLRLIARANRLISCYEWYMNGSKSMEFDGNIIFIEDEIEAFRKGLSRMKSSMGEENAVFLANQNFCKFIRLLLQHSKEVVDVATMKELRKALKKYQYVTHSKWLESKIEEL